MKSAIAIVGVALLLAGVLVWFGTRPVPEGAAGQAAEGTSEQASTEPPPAAVPSHREEVNTGDLDSDEDDDAEPRRPSVQHAPGMGPLVPVDLTNLAPASLGTDPWFRLIRRGEEWCELWEVLHVHDGPRHDPLEEPASPPAFNEGEEALLLIGLGARPRMDYALQLSPIASEYGEARYEFKVETLPTPPVEVATRPVRVYLLPVAPMRARGLLLVDPKGFELARFDPPSD